MYLFIGRILTVVVCNMQSLKLSVVFSTHGLHTKYDNLPQLRAYILSMIICVGTILLDNLL
jgi:preprotein translocase subunit SecY